jgi:anti-anti-sigma factor
LHANPSNLYVQQQLHNPVMEAPQDQGTSRYEAAVRSFNSTTTTAANAGCRINLVRSGKVLILRIQGKAQQSTLQPLIQELRSVLMIRTLDALVIDLTLCESIGSAAVGLIAFAMMEAKRLGSQLHVVKASDAVTRSLRVMGLDKLCVMHDRLEDAYSE